MPRRQAFCETLLIFAVFFLQGAWPVPDVNEPYYLGKAIHFWNPQWVPHDFFLETPDTHQVFYLAFGWLSFLMTPTVLAWVGRILTWALLAWSWQRLSTAVVPRPWFAVLTGALFAMLSDRCQMAGEWVIGGVEAKGFAYACVFMALEALVRGRWNRMWLWIGGASLFHVLVGGWTAVAAGVAWLWPGRSRPTLRSMLPAMAGCLLLSLPGLLSGLALNRHADPETISQAEQIYVFGRLGHHLDITAFPLFFLIRFASLIVLWAALCCDRAKGPGQRRLEAFVAGALLIAGAGATIGLVLHDHPAAAAPLLRFYWFRLADVAVPLGVALGLAAMIDRIWQLRPAAGKAWLSLAILAAAIHVGDYAAIRPVPTPPRADRWVDHVAWRDACEWIAQSGAIPADACFLTPLNSNTFKWYARRSEVANWKEMPQDAELLVRWWAMLREIYGNDDRGAIKMWRDSLADIRPSPEQAALQLRQLGAKYRAGYVVTQVEHRLPLPILYENELYVIYRLPETEQP
jgi:hypothetical protein